VDNEAQVTVPPGETVRAQLLAQATAVLCRRFGDINFEFDRSFIIPEQQTVDLLRSISGYAAQFSNRQILIVGHTDTMGDPDYNIRLSKRRGMSAYAHLTGDEDVWWSMYKEENRARQKWGNREGRHMLRFLKDDSGAPYFTGTADDKGTASTEAIKRFQRDNGLKVDGVAGRDTHLAMFHKLVEAFRADGIGIPPGRFLATNGSDFWLGCGERYLAVQTPDETKKEKNRRVEFLFFLQPPSPIEYKPEWVGVCVKSELITVEVLIHDEYAEPLAIEFTLDTPEGDTLREVTGADGLWRSLPNSMPPGRYVLTVSGKEVTLVR
jgi:hypothetical protein